MPDISAKPAVLRGPAQPDLLRDECLPDLLAATARLRPVHPALVWGEHTVTYGELAVLAERVAGALCRHDACAGRVVGLFLPRGADLLIAQAGISRSGAAWLPFDAATPPERIRVCLEAADACGLVTCREWLPRFAGALPVPVWTLEDLLAESAPPPPAGNVRPDDPAYVIYTSGSTGTPKGIEISHRSICHFLRSENEILGVNGDDRVYQGFSVAFDMSFEEIWISYLVGATLWIAPGDLVGDPERITQALAAHHVTVIHAVPTLMGLLDALPPSVRLVNLGGEACPDALARRLVRPGLKVFNTYGPTEATVSASIAELAADRAVTIGMPLPNYGLMVLDEERQPVGFGETGELCIFGVGLAIGYLRRPELTAERFIANPLAENDAEKRLYLTGDLAKIEPGGPVHCLGRTDGQVKVRGFRVELGEIEAVLAAQPGVAAAAVVLGPLGGVDQLVAFYVAAADAGTPADSAPLRKALAARLPSYMVPAHFERVEQLPRLPSAKVDRKALAALPLAPLAVAGAAGSAEPRNEDEAALFAVLRKLFPDAALRPEADFFDDLGGHSLLAARLVSLLRADARYAQLGVGDVYRERRLDALAAALSRNRERGERTAANGGAKSARTRTPAPWGRRTLCGLAQAAVVPELLMLHIVSWLAPFFTYHYFTGGEDDSRLLAVVYSLAVFVAVELALFGVSIAGKWLVQGRLKPGRVPLWGFHYFRWWLGNQFHGLAPVYLLTGTPMFNWYLRAMGAKIGKDVLMDSPGVNAPELLVVGDGASLGTAVHIENARVEGGMLVLGEVRIGRDAVVDSYTVIEGGAELGDGARLGGLSALAEGVRVPAGENWEGAPARKVERTFEALPPRPRPGIFQRTAQTAFFIVAGIAVALLFFMPVFPSFMLIDWLDAKYFDFFESEPNLIIAFLCYFMLAIPASALLVTLTALITAGVRRLFLPKQQEGRFSMYGIGYCRKWLLTRMLDSSLGTLHGLYASIYAPLWLRLMGAKVGRDAEVSTAVGIVPDLLRLGNDSFIADGVMLGDEEQRGGWMILHPTTVGNRSFVGNGAYVADGAQVPDDVLIGVQTRTPDNHQLQSGQTWMGSPPLLLPARENIGGFDERLTFRPSPWRRLARGFIEALRIVLPLAFVIAAGYLIVLVTFADSEPGRLLIPQHQTSAPAMGNSAAAADTDEEEDDDDEADVADAGATASSVSTLPATFSGAKQAGKTKKQKGQGGHKGKKAGAAKKKAAKQAAARHGLAEVEKSAPPATPRKPSAIQPQKLSPTSPEVAYNSGEANEDEPMDWPVTLWTLAVAGFLYGLVSFLLVVVLKWALVGRYRPRAAPMWTLFVWLSEAVTCVYESLAVPNFLEFLRGTPMLPWALRLLGARIGHGTYLDTTDLTEFDCVSIGDRTELNNWCGPQTHLFEDRVMKIGGVEIGADVTVGACSTILYNSKVGDRVRLGPLTLVAKGEHLPPDSAWEGSPAAPLHGD